MTHIALIDLAVDETLERSALELIYGGFSWKRFGIAAGIAVGGVALAATGVGILGFALLPLLTHTVVGTAVGLGIGVAGLGAIGGGFGLFGWGGYRAVRAF